MIYITRRLEFCASHRLFNPRFSDKENEEIFGLCNNPNGHGHNYVLEVTVKGDINPDTGMVLDLKMLKKLINREIVDKVDHKNFNMDVDFMNPNVTMSSTVEIDIKDLTAKLLVGLGEDPSREGLQNTPERVEKSLKFLTSGYQTNIDELVNGALYQEDYDEMVIIKDIDLYSLCEHHMLPFLGKCHVAYLPKGRIIGLSKIPRIVDAFGRRLQVQERLTKQIAECLDTILQPQGVGVVIEALHLCMSMRGVEKQSSYTTTSSMLGSFKSDARTRSEFLSLIQPQGTRS